MKKIKEKILPLLIDLFSIGLIFAGLIMIIICIFTPASLFQAITVTALGFILYGISTLYFNFVKMIEIMSRIIEKFNEQVKNVNSERTVEEIIITDKTTPEEIEMYKEKFPELKDKLDSIFDDIKTNDFLKQIGNFKENNLNENTLINYNPYITYSHIFKNDMQKLEDDLKKAVENDDFEKAAEIRDEIKKLKM